MITRTEQKTRNGGKIGQPRKEQISVKDIEMFVQSDLRDKFTVLSINETRRATMVTLEKHDKACIEGIYATYKGPAKFFHKALVILKTQRVAAALS